VVTRQASRAAEESGNNQESSQNKRSKVQGLSLGHDFEEEWDEDLMNLANSVSLAQ
jgi:hypothetical protein